MTNKYLSSFSSGREISAAQYITELICKNKAKKNKTSLPPQFYNLPEWRNFYVAQIKKAYELLEEYHEVILIRIIQQKNIYSLYAKWIKNEFDKETKKTLQLGESIDKTQYERNISSKGKFNKDIDLGYLDE